MKSSLSSHLALCERGVDASGVSSTLRGDNKNMVSGKALRHGLWCDWCDESRKFRGVGAGQEVGSRASTESKAAIGLTFLGSRKWNIISEESFLSPKA